MKIKKEKPEVQFPCLMYLRGRNGYISEFVVTGETSRSWITGPSWRQIRWAKLDYSPVSKEDYDLWIWDCTNRAPITRSIASKACVSTALLKAVAELIGHVAEAK